MLREITAAEGLGDAERLSAKVDRLEAKLEKSLELAGFVEGLMFDEHSSSPLRFGGLDGFARMSRDLIRHPLPSLADVNAPFSATTRLYEGAGTARLNTRQSQDILSLQIRLMTQGRLSLGEATFGVLDSATADAVVGFREASGLMPRPVFDRDTRSMVMPEARVVDATVWQKLGLTLYTGPQLAGPFTPTPSHLMGQEFAHALLEDVFTHEWRSRITGNQVNHASVSFGQIYYSRMVAEANADRALSGLEIVTKLAETGYKGIKAAGLFKTGDWAAAAQTGIGAIHGVASLIPGVNLPPIDDGPPTALSAFLKSVADNRTAGQATQNAKAQFLEVANSPLGYVLNPNNTNVSQAVISNYLNALIGTAQLINSINPNALDIHEDFDFAVIQNISISFIEDIIRLQIDSNQRQGALDAINAMNILDR